MKRIMIRVREMLERDCLIEVSAAEFALLTNDREQVRAERDAAINGLMQEAQKRLADAVVESTRVQAWPDGQNYYVFAGTWESL